MNQSDVPSPHEQEPPVPAANLGLKIPIAVVAGLAGAVAGAYITLKIPGIYIPLLPGVVVGYAVLMACRTTATPVAVVGAVCGLISQILFEALALGEGLAWFGQFYRTDDMFDWVWRGLNTFIGFWLSRPRM